MKSVKTLNAYLNGEPGRASYRCEGCKLSIEADRITFMNEKGVKYSKGEYAPCPNCNKENLIN